MQKNVRENAQEGNELYSTPRKLGNACTAGDVGYVGILNTNKEFVMKIINILAFSVVIVFVAAGAWFFKHLDTIETTKLQAFESAGTYTIVFHPEDGGPERDYCTVREIGYHSGEYNIMAFCTATRPPDDS